MPSPGSRRYIPAVLQTFDKTHMKCDVCSFELVGKIKAYDYEDYREKVIELAELHGWVLGFDVLCRDCNFDQLHNITRSAHERKA